MLPKIFQYLKRNASREILEISERSGQHLFVDRIFRAGLIHISPEKSGFKEYKECKKKKKKKKAYLLN